MIETADSLYKSDATYSNKSGLIINNFKKLIGAILKNKAVVTLEGSSNSYDAINEESIKQAKLAVCPLFGFCK